MSFADPRRNISQLMLSAGMKVADLGAGPGHYAVLASDLVGEHGEVFLIDIQQELLTKARTHGAIERKNLRFICGDLERPGGSGIASAHCDAVIVSNLLFQMEDKHACANEACRILKAAGRVMVIDWTDSWGGIGPAKEHVISREQARALFLEAGFRHQRDFDAGQHHWGMILDKRHSQKHGQ